MEEDQKVDDANECCSARDVLWYLVFTGFVVNAMICINLNIAIVSMVQVQTKINASIASECFADGMYPENTTLINTVLLSSTESVLNVNDTESTDLRDQESKNDTNEEPENTQFLKFESKKFDWNVKQQNKILGSFFWLHWTTQLPGAILAGRYGTKMVFGLSNFMSVLCCFFIPFCAYKGPGFLLFVRIVQGLIAGFSWSAIHGMTAKWIPRNETSKFMTVYLGSSMGTALTYLLCGYTIDRWGWEVVFYGSGVLGTLWFFAWGALVFDSPNEHPRISEEEREYITANLGHSVTGAEDKIRVPWLKILGSTPVLMNIVAQCGGIFGFFTLTTHAPTYFKFIHGWNIRTIGLLSGIPHFLRMLWAFIFSQFGDYLLRSNKISRTNVRKLATTVCCIVQGAFVVGLAYSGCSYTSGVVFLALAVASHGAVSTGPMASIIDISPNYTSIIVGLSSTVVAMMGFLTPVMVGQLTSQNQTVEQWQKIFLIAASVLIATGTLYIFFAKSELQSWNSPKEQDELPETELLVLGSGNEDVAEKETGYQSMSH